MKIECKKCSALYSVDDSLLEEEGGVGVQCPACGNIQIIGGESGRAGIDRQGAQPPPLPTGNRPRPAGSVERVAEKRCERCGSLMPAGRVGTICSRCIEITGSAGEGVDDESWRIRLNDGVVLGPLTTEEVREKFRNGEIDATSMVAQGDGDYKLISSYSEFSMFFKRPSQVTELRLSAPRAKRSGAAFVLAAIVLAALGAGIWWWLNKHRDTGEKHDSPLTALLDYFRMEVGSPNGDPGSMVSKARALMSLDDRIGYLRANKLLMSAILLRPDDVEAASLWIINLAMMDTIEPDPLLKKKALELLQYLKSKHQQDSMVRLAEGYLLLVTGQQKQAWQLVRKIKNENEDNPYVRLLEAASFIESSTSLALENLEKLLSDEKVGNMATRLAAEACEKTGHYARALKYWERRRKQDPAQLEIVLRLGDFYVDVGKYKKALELYDTILAAERGNLKVALRVARIRSQMLRDPVRALRVLEQFKKNNGKLDDISEASLLTEISVCQRIAGRLKEAEKNAKAAYERAPAYVPAAYAYALALKARGDVIRALELLKGLKAHLPKSSHLYVHLADVWAMVPNVQRAVENLKVALELNPRSPTVHAWAAGFFLNLDNVERAASLLNAALRLDLLYDVQHHGPSEVYDDDALLKTMAKTLEKTMARYSDQPLMLSLAGLVLTQAGRYSKADLFLRKALELDPENFAANFVMGWLNFRKRKWRTAEGFLREALKDNSGSLSARVLLAKTMAARGNVKEAMKQFKAVLQLDEANLQAKLGLASLSTRTNARRARNLLSEIWGVDSQNVELRKVLFRVGY